MKFEEIKDLSLKELVKKRSVMVEELFNARMKNSLGQLANPVQIRGIRKDIARINTVISRKAAH